MTPGVNPSKTLKSKRNLESEGMESGGKERKRGFLQHQRMRILDNFFGFASIKEEVY